MRPPVVRTQEETAALTASSSEATCAVNPRHCVAGPRKRAGHAVMGCCCVVMTECVSARERDSAPWVLLLSEPKAQAFRSEPETESEVTLPVRQGGGGVHTPQFLRKFHRSDMTLVFYSLTKSDRIRKSETKDDQNENLLKMWNAKTNHRLSRESRLKRREDRGVCGLHSRIKEARLPSGPGTGEDQSPAK